MAEETIFQHWIISQFILPFLLIFVVMFAILQKTKLLGENKQIDAIVSFVIGIIFVGAIFPKMVVGNLILFLTIAIIVVFITLLLWGFVTGDEPKLLTGDKTNWVTWTVGIVLVLAVIIAVLWATGSSNEIIDFLFDQDWSSSFWMNLVFIVVIAVAIAVVVRNTGGSG